MTCWPRAIFCIIVLIALQPARIQCFGIIEIFSDASCTQANKLGEVRMASMACVVGMNDGCRKYGSEYNTVTCPSTASYEVDPTFHAVNLYSDTATCGNTPDVFAVVPSAVGTCLHTAFLSFQITETCSTNGQLVSLISLGTECAQIADSLLVTAVDGACQPGESGTSSKGFCSSSAPISNTPIATPGPASGARVTKVYSDSNCQNQIAEMQEFPLDSGCIAYGVCTKFGSSYVRIDCPTSVDFSFSSAMNSLFMAGSQTCDFTGTPGLAWGFKTDGPKCAYFPSFGSVRFGDTCGDVLQWGLIPGQDSCGAVELTAYSNSTTCGVVLQGAGFTGYHSCAAANGPGAAPIAPPSPAPNARVTKVYSDNNCQNLIAEMQEAPIVAGSCTAQNTCTATGSEYVRVECAALSEATFPLDWTALVMLLTPGELCNATKTAFVAFGMKTEQTNCAYFPAFGSVRFGENCGDVLEWGVLGSQRACNEVTLSYVSNSTTCGVVIEEAAVTGYHTCAVPLPPGFEPVPANNPTSPIATPSAVTPVTNTMPNAMTPVTGATPRSSPGSSVTSDSFGLAVTWTFSLVCTVAVVLC